MHRPAARASVIAAAALCIALVAASGAWSASRSPHAAWSRGRIQALYDRLHRQKVARWLHPQPGIPFVPNAAAGGGAFVTAKHVEEISQDTLGSPGTSEPDTEAEPAIAVDPNDPKHVVGVFQQSRFPDQGSVDPGFASSLDGGATWTDGSLPGLTVAVGGPFDRASDPSVAFGPDGAVYAATLPFDVHDNRNGVSVQRSDDGGLTWGAPVFAQDDNTGVDDKSWIAVDTFPGSPHLGRVYIVWDRPTAQGQPTLLRWSDDRGVNWSVQKMVTDAGEFTLGPQPVVQPNGDLTVVYEDLGSGRVAARTSHDGGATFDPKVAIAPDLASDPPDQRAGSDLPSVAVDPTNGRLYVAWGDTRFHSDGLMDAVLSRSNDGGASWSVPVRVNQDPVTDGIDHLTPAVAANDGFVHVTYLTRAVVGGSFQNTVQERYIVSSDVGHTFGGELVLGPNINLKWSARSRGKFLGDYMAVAATRTKVHPVWCRSSKPLSADATYHQTTWSATIAK
jgi:BNR repeat protein